MPTLDETGRRPSPRATARSPPRILAEAIRIPADYVDRPVDEGGDPLLRPQQPRGAAAAST